jgi:membrane protein DedA with SNARE-associated domain
MKDARMNIDAINAWIDALSDAVDLKTIFIASLVEKFLPVLPSYILFPAIGSGASSTEDLLVRCLIATLGSVGGALGWYGIGMAIGEDRVRSFVQSYGKWFFLKPKIYEQMSQSYYGNPFTFTVFGQLVPTVRIFHALPAGVIRLPLGPFLVATALGALCWIGALACVGYVVRLHGWTVSETGSGLLIALVAFEGMVMLAMISLKRVRKHRRVDVSSHANGPQMRGYRCIEGSSVN